jgi:glycosyltransferase involved in cell wall biosynthesis
LRSQVIAIGSTMRRNRIGRAFSLWMTARAAGLRFRYVGLDDGPLWEPLRAHQGFSSDVQVATDIADLERQVAVEIGPDSALVVCKPRPELLSLARKLAPSAPVIVDVDDPELEVGWGTTRLRSRAALLARYGPSRFRFRWAKRTVSRMQVITSNPALQNLYGGEIVPHVRDATPTSRAHDRDATPFTVGFIGTPRPYKGIDEMRTAMAQLSRERPVRLCITAPPPDDARPWEDWVGATSIDEGRRLLECCDAVAVVSHPGSWGEHQVPVKLIDAMHAAVPAVITPRPPLLWAAGGTSVVVPDGRASEITNAFRLLADDFPLAKAFGAASRQRAHEVFTPKAAAPHLLAALDRVDADWHRDRV